MAGHTVNTGRREPTYLGHICDTKNKANRVKDVRLAGSIEASNCIERWIPACNLCPDWIRLETCEENDI